jgi:cytochrome c-type biogenesis protein CcmH
MPRNPRCRAESPALQIGQKAIPQGLKPNSLSSINAGAKAPTPDAKHVSRKVFGLCALLVFAATPLLLAQTGYSARAKEIGMHLKCQCRGCEMSAGGCAHPGGAFSGPCDTAKGMLREIDQHLAKGESEQQIIEAFVAQYGTVVYVEPPKKGFGLVAWLMPVIYFILGLALVVFVVRKWAVRAPSATAHGAASNLQSDALARARAQAARETED